MKLRGLCRAAVLLCAAAFMFSCKAAPIESGAGSISEGTLRYLHAVFPRKTGPEESLDELKKLEARGELASDLGLQEDPHYKKFLLLSRRARCSRGAGVIVKEVYRGQVSDDPFRKILGFSSSLKEAVREVQDRRKVEGNRVSLKEETILLGDYDGKKLFLKELRPLLLKEEWEQMISLTSSSLEKSLYENTTLWIQHKLNRDLMARLKADDDEAERFDHNDVAGLFLSRKYGAASEGIYPVRSFKLPLKPPELLEHFVRMRTSWNPIEAVEARATVVKDLKTAQNFVERLNKNKDFLNLARCYSREKKYIKTARLHRVAGYGSDVSLKNRERFTVLDRLIIETARQNSYKPEIFRVFRGYAVVQVSKIHLLKGDFKYRDYKDFVRLSLTRKLLEKQYPIDLMDTEEKLDFKIDMKRALSILKGSEMQ